MQNKLLYIFWDADLRGRQPSLIAQVKKSKKFKWRDLKQGDMIAFVNHKMNRFAILAGIDEADGFGIYSYYRSPQDKRMDPHAIGYVPQAFNGKELNMHQALKLSIENRLMKKKRAKVKTATRLNGKANESGNSLSLQ